MTARMRQGRASSWSGAQVFGKRAAGAAIVAALTGMTWRIALATELPQQAPPASGARILLLPRRIVSGERATLAVLDMNGRLTPGVNVVFSNGDHFTTDATGRALFVAPLNPGVILGSIEGRRGRVPTTILSPAETSAGETQVTLAPRVASLSDRFELGGTGFCGDADANRVAIGGHPALVLASSPVSLIVLPPAELTPGPANVQVSCGKRAPMALSMAFVGLELDADASAIAPRDHRVLTVRVSGTTRKIILEARNLAPEVAELAGGVVARVSSTGGANNIAQFEVIGRKRGSFLISIRLIPGMGPPRPGS